MTYFKKYFKVKKIDEKLIFDIKNFNKCLKILKKPKKKIEYYKFTKNLFRYETTLNARDIVGCAEIVSELKIYLDGTVNVSSIDRNIKDDFVLQNIFLKALKNITQISCYHKKLDSNYYWQEFEKILLILKLPISRFNMKIHSHIFEDWKNNTYKSNLE